VRALENSSSVYEDTDNLQCFEFVPFISNGFTYPDGTGLMQLTRFDNATFQTENNLYIRLLHPNGTLTKFTVPTYNSTKYRPQAFPLNDGYVLVMQANDDQIIHGMLVNWSGQILQSDVMLTDGPIDNASRLRLLVKANVDPDKDFLVTIGFQWKIFSAPDITGQITQLYKGSITRHDGNWLGDYSIFPTTEGGYGIAVLEKLLFGQVKDPLVSKLFHYSPQWFLYVRFWQPDTLQFDTPHLVWQNPIPYYSIQIEGCEVAAEGTGYFCILEVPNTRDYVRVGFLSSGSVTDVNVISDDTENIEKIINGIRPLPC
ncbi:2633_t:CDS:2, partial [Paraglomus occultum]